MITRVSQRVDIFYKIVKCMAVISWIIILITKLLEFDISQITNTSDFLWMIFFVYEETVAYHALAIAMPIFVIIYPLYYKSTTELIKKKDFLVCYRFGTTRYKLYYSEIKECYKFTYKLFGKKITALFISTEKGDKPCSLLNITTRRSKKNIKHRLYFDCVDEASSAMADYVIDKVNNCAK